MEDNFSQVSPIESKDSTVTKKRRKRMWDQPAEILVSAGVAVPSAVSSYEAVLASTIGVSSKAIPSLFPPTSPKINQPKIQDELIAREIVINDADSAIRYKLTKRQTQEEIQRCSGAVVITRGKYHPLNAPADHEKPLYLHISAGAHLETTLERIKAVDVAASMVEEMLKQTSVNNVSKVVHPLNISVFMGFEADSSLNIAARIRGPNDQYVNHIMNETGATVVLRGHGSGNSWSSLDEERQPLHLFLTSSNPQSLERAKLLAENLMDTISREFGASRTSSNVCGAVPPPQQLASAQCYVNSVIIPPVSSAIPSQPTVGCYPSPSLTRGTSYYGYGGIYPQATPLQQVALALRHSSPSLTNSTAVQSTTETTPAATSSERLSSEKEKRRRKFQELPAASANGCAKSDQVFSLTLYEALTGWFCASVGPFLCYFHRVFIDHSRRWTPVDHCSIYETKTYTTKLLQGAPFLKPSDPNPVSIEKNVSTFLAPKKFAYSAVNEMPPPPPRTIPPPPVPKFNSPEVSKINALDKLKQESLPDTLFKLMEYGDEDDDDDETAEEPRNRDSNGLVSTKPFWSV